MWTELVFCLKMNDGNFIDLASLNLSNSSLENQFKSLWMSLWRELTTSFSDVEEDAMVFVGSDEVRFLG